jgi:pilus assembly protein Flp/PilA
MKRKYLSLKTTLAQDTNSFRTPKPRRTIMTVKNLILKVKALRDTSGQDLIEYALMAGFVAVVAGALMPGVAASISTIFSQIGSVMTSASTQG